MLILCVQHHFVGLIEVSLDGCEAAIWLYAVVCASAMCTPTVA